MNKQKWYTFITYSFSILILFFIILVRYFVFDYIILGDILECLFEPTSLLKKIKTYL